MGSRVTKRFGKFRCYPMLPAWKVGANGIALLDELAKPEIETGQLEWISDVFLTKFNYYLIPGVSQQLSSSALNFQSWLKAQAF